MGKFRSLLKTAILFVFSALLVTSSLTKPVYAAQGGRSCIITINGVVLSNTNDGDTVASKKVTPKDGGDRKLVFDVTVQTTAAQPFDFTDPFNIYFNRWYTVGEGSAPLTIVNPTTATGQIVLYESQITFDTQTDQYNPFSFWIDRTNGQDVCQERWGALGAIPTETSTNWDAKELQMCGTLSVAPADITENNSLNISYMIPAEISGQNLDPKGVAPDYGILILRGGSEVYRSAFSGGVSGAITKQVGPFPVGDYTVRMFNNYTEGYKGPVQKEDPACRKIFCVGTATTPGHPGTNCDGTQDDTNPSLPVTKKESFKICAQIHDAKIYADCIACAGGTAESQNPDEAADINGIWTGIGCIPTNPESLIQTLIRAGLAISGGVALLMFLGAAFLLSTSQGDKKRADQAKELMTSAVFGLLFIIFSVTILQFIGVKVLQIPGFGSKPAQPAIESTRIMSRDLS